MATARKTAFISGSARNIGRAIALRLARDGFNIVVNGSRDRDACELVASEVRQAGVDAMVAMGNVAAVPMCARWPVRCLINSGELMSL